ncbi:MAG: hypothetical protein ACK52U_12895 [Synechococcaceae cyanobacterium]
MPENLILVAHGFGGEHLPGAAGVSDAEAKEGAHLIHFAANPYGRHAVASPQQAGIADGFDGGERGANDRITIEIKIEMILLADQLVCG